MKTLAELRIKANLSQLELSLKLGVAQPTVAGWELGTYKPLPKRWGAIAHELHVGLGTMVRMWT